MQLSDTLSYAIYSLERQIIQIQADKYQQNNYCKTQIVWIRS